MKPIVIVMGVSGSGKTTVGRELAMRLGLPFFDADDFHSATNRHKMEVLRQPLTDEDRRPWLEELARSIRDWRGDRGGILACSALKQAYREVLESGGPVSWVYLQGDPSLIAERLSRRTEHFFSPPLLASQFRDLEEPNDAIQVDISKAPGEIVTEIVEQMPRDSSMGVGSATAEIGAQQLQEIVSSWIDRELRGVRRLLLIPPDASRRRSFAGEIVQLLVRHLAGDVQVDLLPALGTHRPMSQVALQGMFGSALDRLNVLEHDFRQRVRSLGVMDSDDVLRCSQGRLQRPLRIDVSQHLDGGYDRIVSIGQVVPHEVAGMANYTKNIVIGVGGKEAIDATHYLSALCGIESIMGQIDNPVRTILDTAYDRFVRPTYPMTFLLTVVETRADGDVLRGIFGGCERSVFVRAAELSQQTNIIRLEEPLQRCVVWLDPKSYQSTWLGNKAIYRTRRAMADGGELVILAPALDRFGETRAIDSLIRHHGYRGTPRILSAVRDNAELAENLSAAAHLIHGSTEGRFDVVYCPGPGMTRTEIESVGYRYRSYDDAAREFPPDQLAAGWQTGSSADYFVAHPGMGLWVA